MSRLINYFDKILWKRGEKLIVVNTNHWTNELHFLSFELFNNPEQGAENKKKETMHQKILMRECLINITSLWRMILKQKIMRICFKTKRATWDCPEGSNRKQKCRLVPGILIKVFIANFQKRLSINPWPSTSLG